MLTRRPQRTSTMPSFANKFKETGDRHCQKFQALYEAMLADVRDCLELRAGRKWPARHPCDIGEARSREAFLYAALADEQTKF